MPATIAQITSGISAATPASPYFLDTAGEESPSRVIGGREHNGTGWSNSEASQGGRVDALETVAIAQDVSITAIQELASKTVNQSASEAEAEMTAAGRRMTTAGVAALKTWSASVADTDEIDATWNATNNTLDFTDGTTTEAVSTELASAPAVTLNTDADFAQGTTEATDRVTIFNEIVRQFGTLFDRLGITFDAADWGAFTGSTISDNGVNLIAVLQELETKIETVELLGDFVGGFATTAELVAAATSDKDWGILNTAEGGNVAGIYASNGTTISLAIELKNFLQVADPEIINDAATDYPDPAVWSKEDWDQRFSAQQLVTFFTQSGGTFDLRALPTRRDRVRYTVRNASSETNLTIVVSEASEYTVKVTNADGTQASVAPAADNLGVDIPARGIAFVEYDGAEVGVSVIDSGRIQRFETKPVAPVPVPFGALVLVANTGVLWYNATGAYEAFSGDETANWKPLNKAEVVHRADGEVPVIGSDNHYPQGSTPGALPTPNNSGESLVISIGTGAGFTSSYYASNLAGDAFVKQDESTAAQGLRGEPVADNAALTAVSPAREYERRQVKSTGKEYVFKLTADLTAAEDANALNIADDDGTGKWVEVTRELNQLIGVAQHFNIGFNSGTLNQGYLGSQDEYLTPQQPIELGTGSAQFTVDLVANTTSLESGTRVGGAFQVLHPDGVTLLRTYPFHEQTVDATTGWTDTITFSADVPVTGTYILQAVIADGTGAGNRNTSGGNLSVSVVGVTANTNGVPGPVGPEGPQGPQGALSFVDVSKTINAVLTDPSGSPTTTTDNIVLPVGNVTDFKVHLTQQLAIGVNEVGTAGGRLVVKNSGGTVIRSLQLGNRRCLYSEGYRNGDFDGAQAMFKVNNLPAGTYTLEFTTTDPKSIGGHREPTSSTVRIDCRVWTTV